MAEFERTLAEVPSPRARAGSRGPVRDPLPLLRLQRLAGNAAVSGLVTQRQEENLPTQSGGGGGGMQMVNLVALGKSGLINIKLQNGQVLDASATLG